MSLIFRSTKSRLTILFVQIFLKLHDLMALQPKQRLGVLIRPSRVRSELFILERIAKEECAVADNLMQKERVGPVERLHIHLLSLARRKYILERPLELHERFKFDWRVSQNRDVNIAVLSRLPRRVRAVEYHKLQPVCFCGCFKLFLIVCQFRHICDDSTLFEKRKVRETNGETHSMH